MGLVESLKKDLEKGLDRNRTIDECRKCERELYILTSGKCLNILYLLNNFDKKMSFEEVGRRISYDESKLVFDMILLKNNDYVNYDNDKNMFITNKGREITNFLEKIYFFYGS